jgi:hypothetical protein
MEDFKEITSGDLILHLNRGVADSLFEKDISKIISNFLDAEVDFKDPLNLQIIAEVITTAAYEKITNFSTDRPLVQKLRRGNIDPMSVTVDECLCAIEYFYHD